MEKSVVASTSSNAMGRSSVVYKSFGQCLQALTTGPIKDTTHVRNIVDVCRRVGILDQHALRTSSRNRTRYPFIVVEGLDGTGKSTLTKLLKNKLQMVVMSTPPKHHEFTMARQFFDVQSEPLRRAFYSVGNYITAVDVIQSLEQKPVVMDRFWHSTAAYALATQLKNGIQHQESDLEWPQDLQKPDLVILLVVSEEERLRRHANRKNFTNTAEEQTLAKDAEFRKNLLQFLRSVKGPPVVELRTDGGYRQSQEQIIRAVLSAFPELDCRLTNRNYLN